MTFEDSSDYIITQNPNVNSPLCAGSDIIFTGPSGFNYQWTGPNSFSSNLQNPVVTNSTNLNSGIYNLIISNNCGFIKIMN